MNKLLTIVVLLCTFSLPVKAANVSGAIHSNTNWTLANSPYIVTSDLIVFDNATLTIDAGVQVLVDTQVKIEIKGRLRAMGMAGNEVVIKGNTGTNNWQFWQGIMFTGLQGPGDTLQADLVYCNISNATQAINLSNGFRGPYKFRRCSFTYNRIAVGEHPGGGPVSFSHCTFKYSQTAMYNPNAAITNCIFEGNETGIEQAEMVKDCKFTHHSKYAIRKVYQIVHCEITDNHIGVELTLGPAVDGVVDNTITGNDTGLVIYSCYTGHKFLNNKICNPVNVVATQTFSCDLPYNCWCGMDSTAVRGTIYDGYNDITLGTIQYTPMNTVCHPTAIPGIPANDIAFNVYPNPNSGSFTLQLQHADLSNTSVKVYDIMGRECYNAKVTAGQSRITLNQPKGIYLIKLQSGEKIVTRQTVIE